MKTAYNVIYRFVLMLIAMSRSAQCDDLPRDAFFCGVEDRIREAEAIVAGRAQLLDEIGVNGTTSMMVRARIQVATVLKGDAALRSIDYSYIYRPFGFTLTGDEKYWGAEDEDHSRLIESFPYSTDCDAVFFLKKAGGSWRPFYVYLDVKRATRDALMQIMKSEELIKVEDPAAALRPLVDAAEPLLVQEYALRSAMTHVSSWSSRADIVKSAVSGIPSNATLFCYAAGLGIAHLRQATSSVDIQQAANLVVGVIKVAPTSGSLDSVVGQLQTAVPFIRGHRAEATALTTALAKRRSELSLGETGREALTARDRQLLSDLDVPLGELRSGRDRENQ